MRSVPVVLFDTIKFCLERCIFLHLLSILCAESQVKAAYGVILRGTGSKLMYTV